MKTIPLSSEIIMPARAHEQVGAQALAICEQLHRLGVPLPGALARVLQQRAEAWAAVTAVAAKSALKAGVDLENGGAAGEWEISLGEMVLKKKGGESPQPIAKRDKKP